MPVGHVPLGVVVIAVVVLAVSGAWASSRRGATAGLEPTWLTLGLRWAAFVMALVTAVQLWGDACADSPEFAPIALGMPIAGTALPVVVSGMRRVAVVVTWVGALGLLVWALLLGLGFGMALLPPAMLLLVAAVAQHGDGAQARPDRRDIVAHGSREDAGRR